MFKINKIETYQIACHCQHIDKISLIEPADPPLSSPFFYFIFFYFILFLSSLIGAPLSPPNYFEIADWAFPHKHHNKAVIVTYILV